MVNWRRYLGKKPAPKSGCDSCVNPDCAASMKYLKDFDINISREDLMDMSSNLIDRLVLEEPECERYMAEVEEEATRKPPRKRSVKMMRELDSLRDEVRELQEDLVQSRKRAEKAEESLTELSGSVGFLVSVAKGEADKDESGNSLQKLFSDIQGRIDGLEKRMPEPADERLEELWNSVEELADTAADRETAKALEKRIEELKALSAERSELDELGRKIEEITEGFAAAEIVADLSEKLDKMGERGADKEEVERLSQSLSVLSRKLPEREDLTRSVEKVEEIWSRYADREFVTKVADQVDGIEETYADRETLDEIAARLVELKKTAAYQDGLEELAEKLSELGEAAAEKNALKDVADRLSQLGETAAEKKALHQVADDLSSLSEIAADKTALGEVDKKLGELATTAATREALEEVSETLEKLKESAAYREALDEVASELKSLSEKSADQEALDTVASELKELSDIAADRKSLEEVEQDLARVKEIYAEKSGLEDVVSAVEDVRSELALITEHYKVLQEKVDDDSALDDTLMKFSALQESMKELERTIKEEPLPPDVENRITGLELGLSQALASVTAGNGVALASLEDAKGVLGRLASMEKQYSALKDDLTILDREARETTKSEITDLKKQVMILEARTRPEAPKPRPPSRLAPVKDFVIEHKTPVVAISALFLFAVALGLSMAAWKIGNMNGGGNNGNGLDYAPNVLYEDMDQFLAPPTLDITGSRMTLDGGRTTITGYAPGAVHAYLYINNREAGYTGVVDHGFKFEDVELEYGKNVIEVKVVDASRNEATSIASIVEMFSTSRARVLARKGMNRMRGPRELPFLALTFDAGASQKRAEKVLDILKENGIVTTIFLTGQFMERYPEITKRIVADGHEVGNHTYSHPHLTTFDRNRRHNTRAGVNKERFQEELRKTRNIFEGLTGAKMTHWWRAPYGEHNHEILEWAEEDGLGFKHVDWTRTPRNLDMLDWMTDEGHDYYLDAKGIKERLVSIDRGVKGGANGGIILMHLGSDRSDEYMDETLPEAIDELREKGYQFVTVSRMFAE